MPPSKPQTTKKVSAPETAPHDAPRWKWAALGFIAFIIISVAVWSTGIIQDAMAGPKIPLPRQTTDFALGTSEDDFLKVHPDLKKSIHKFNNDPQFQIVTVTPKNGLTSATSVDLLFFKKQLYFISVMWDGEKAKAVDVKSWAKQYRRWNNHGNDSEPLGDQVLLKEWHFSDNQTEMVLRDLNYPDHVQRWQDLRDASNAEAQAAFAKYRLDAAG